jgi:hypothetical protein
VKIKNILLTILLASQIFYTWGQTKKILSGYIKDSNNGETLIGANIYVKENPQIGTTTNIYGFYSLSLNPGSYTVVSSYLGYQNSYHEITINEEDIRLNIALQSSASTLEEFVVKAERTNENTESTDMGRVELSSDQIKSIPALFGEVDIMKAIQLLPGIQAAGEGNSGIYVRGGGPDQNLVLLDDAIVYNVGHLFGFFSVFNADAVKNTTVIKGAMPAEYGGRLSSVIDISMKDGNDKKHELEGGIGLISSRITAQGPFKKEKSSYLISARRTYIFDLAQPFLNKTDLAGTNYHFYDINLKANYRFSDKDRLYLSGYFGRDVFVYNSVPRNTEIKIPWGNATATLRWNHLFNNKMFMNASFIFTDYKFEFGGAQRDFNFKLLSGIRDYNVKVDFDYYPNEKHSIKFGYHYTYHRFTPNTAEATSGDAEFKTDISRRHAMQMAAYIRDEIAITDWFKLNIGLRASLFMHVGPFNEVVGDFPNNDTIRYKSLKPIQTYAGLEPRISARFAINKMSSIKAGISFNDQYVHLISTSNSTLPTDLWVPSSKTIKPQRAIQYALGYFQNFKDNEYETSVEVYYKSMRNQIEFGEDRVLELGEDIENSYVFGRGYSYGVETFFKKSFGDFNGWLGYTYSRTMRKFDEINQGRAFPARFDRIHDVSFNASYSLKKKWVFGTTWVYATGNAFTLPNEYNLVGLIPLQQYADRNSFRVPAYHRLDISITYNPQAKKERRFKSSFNFSVYNVYNRRNVYFIYYDVEGDVSSEIVTKAYKVSIFPVIPSLTWNFKF